MKKGFTLIEIIVCIALLSILGVSSVLIATNTSNNELEVITKKVLEAANVYVEVEKDENGNNYLEEVSKGAKGVQIPLTMLVNKGYIEKNVADKVYDLTIPKKDNESYYIMFLSDGTDYCDKNEIASFASWTKNEGEVVKLCKNYTQDPKEKDIIYVNQNSNMGVNLYKFAVSQEFYDNATEEDKNKLVVENGLYTYYNEDTKNTFTYYRGAVNNNYLKLGKIGEEKELIWRILWYSDDKKQMKLVLDDPIPIYILNNKNDKKEIKKNFAVYSYEEDFNFKYTDEILCDDDSSVCKIFTDSDFILNEYIDLTYSAYDSHSYYNKQLFEWYDNTDLNSIEFIVRKNNFCDLTYTRTLGENTDYVSDEFECNTNDGNRRVYQNEGNISSPVGFLSYGDVVRAGFSQLYNMDIAESGNYLINGDYQFILGEDNLGNARNYSYYYISNNGIDYEEVQSYEILYKYYGCLILDQNETILKEIDNVYQDRIFKNTFLGNALKPVIVLDMTNIKLSDSTGTVGDEYTIVNK